MQRHTLRNIAIAAALVLGLIWIYPTIGWATLSPEERQARLDQWAEQEASPEEPGVFEEYWNNMKRWAQFDRDMVINLGLDLQGGVHMIVGLDMDELSDKDRERFEEYGMTEEEIERQLQQTVLNTIERRLAEFEAKEPIIQTLGDRQVQIQLPGEKDVRRAQELITRTAFLTFHIVALPEKTTDVIRDIKNAFPDEFTKYLDPPGPTRYNFRVSETNFERVRTVVEKAKEQDVIEEGYTILFSEPQRGYRELYVVEEEAALTGEHLTSAVARPNQESPGGNWMVLFENDGEGAIEFAQVTRENLQRPMAIVVDGSVVSAPVIQSPIGASGQITGQFTDQEAQDLAIALTSGSLPVPIHEELTAVVGASLGAASVKQGVTSAVIGVIAVMIFMILYYRIAGIVANIALVCNAIFVLALLAYFNATLTLPGIAGLILTVGMAVDANVLIFERIREELRNGKSLAASVQSGFDRARITILDANVTTIIAAAILLQFGTGAIESFAITLSIGVATSVFTALFISRAVFDFLVERKLISKLKMMAIVKPDTNVPFMNFRRPAFAFSAIALIVGMGMFIARGSENFGVDFTTGTNMIVHMETDTGLTVADVRTKLEGEGLTDVRVQQYQSETVESGFSIHIGDVTGEISGEGEMTVSSQVQLALAQLAEGPDITIEQAEEIVVLDRVDTVGPAIGDQLKRDAVVAVIYAMICIVGYLWFRFEYKFAFASIVALAHDVLFTLGIFALADKELSLSVIAALLTIIGYSLNDTIVVFDRIREDLKLYRGRDMAFTKILDLSMNQTLARTLLTSLTTLFVVVVLYIFGGPAISDFAFTLIIGLIVGTYSSIFVASPSVNFLQNWENKRRRAKLDDEGKGGSRRQKRKKKKSEQIEAAS